MYDTIKVYIAEKRLALLEEELAEQSKELAEQSKELAEQNKELAELKQEQSNPVPKNMETYVDQYLLLMRHMLISIYP
jgi:uncharacterized coiled-coil protein SlyX